MLLLAEEDVGGSSNKTTNGYVRKEVVLLQCHVWQTKVSLKQRFMTKELRRKGSDKSMHLEIPISVGLGSHNFLSTTSSVQWNLSLNLDDSFAKIKIKLLSG